MPFLERAALKAAMNICVASNLCSRYAGLKDKQEFIRSDWLIDKDIDKSRLTLCMWNVGIDTALMILVAMSVAPPSCLSVLLLYPSSFYSEATEM